MNLIPKEKNKRVERKSKEKDKQTNKQTKPKKPVVCWGLGPVAVLIWRRSWLLGQCQSSSS